MTDVVMLVEDNPDDEALTRMAFVRSGVQADVTIARDGAEALSLLGKLAPHEMPRVVLLDLKMPKMDGLEVLRRMRSDERMVRVPVVVLTSSVEPRDVREAYRAGANSYIRKPVNYDEFVRALRALTDYWLGLNEPAPVADKGGL